MTPHRLRRLLLPALLCAALAPIASAQETPKMAAARELALYQGPDRQERLIEAAKKEGELSVYHVYPNLTIMMAAVFKLLFHHAHFLSKTVPESVRMLHKLTPSKFKLTFYNLT